ncbi:hypothetical protein HNP69_000650 [Chryseobacterium koreense]|nr:hypothetical protein [Chryseobacterium koreense]
MDSSAIIAGQTMSLAKPVVPVANRITTSEDN